MNADTITDTADRLRRADRLRGRASRAARTGNLDRAHRYERRARRVERETARARLRAALR